uniref:Ska2 N-terminal domain-containing protein n=1 Tax=Babesia bovis TaxID=5865 RepID=A7ANR4_BABBO|eukprot:XP_001611766.1 hypothetical protein [Babesia bovis T2Bo]
MVDGRWVQPQSVEEAIAFVSNKVVISSCFYHIQFADMGDDLALVEKKLIAEMSARYGTDVFDIHERCQEIRNRVTKLTNDLCELYKARERLVNVIESQLKQSSIIQNIEVSQAQFDEIPALVKRRAKLEQINELYQFLFKKAVERNRDETVTLVDDRFPGSQNKRRKT